MRTSNALHAERTGLRLAAPLGRSHRHLIGCSARLSRTYSVFRPAQVSGCETPSVPGMVSVAQELGAAQWAGLCPTMSSVAAKRLESWDWIMGRTLRSPGSDTACWLRPQLLCLGSRSGFSAMVGCVAERHGRFFYDLPFPHTLLVTAVTAPAVRGGNTTPPWSASQWARRAWGRGTQFCHPLSELPVCF